MKKAVDHVYALLALKNKAPTEYESQIQFGKRYTRTWDARYAGGPQDLSERIPDDSRAVVPHPLILQQGLFEDGLPDRRMHAFRLIHCLRHMQIGRQRAQHIGIVS